MFKRMKKAPWYGYVMLVLLCLAIALPNFAQYQVTSLATRLRLEMGLSQSQYSTIATGPLLAGIFLCFLSGLLMDRFGTKVIVISVLITAGGIVLRIFAEGFWLMYISMVLMGFAASFVNATTPKIMGSWFPPSRVTVLMGVVISIANAGMALGSGTATLFATTDGAFRFAALFAIVVFLLWLFLCAEKKAEAGSAPEEVRAPFVESFKAVLPNKRVWLCALGCLSLSMGVLGCGIFMPQALMSRGLGEQEAAWYGMAITVGNMATSFITPVIIRRFGTTVKRVRNMMAIYSLFASVLAFVAWRLPVGPLLLVGLFVTGFLAMGFVPLFQSMPVYLKGVGSRYAGTATGLVLTVQLLGTVVGPSYIAAPIAGDNYVLLFGILAGISLLPVIVSRVVPVGDMLEAQKAGKGN